MQKNGFGKFHRIQREIVTKRQNASIRSASITHTKDVGRARTQSQTSLCLGLLCPLLSSRVGRHQLQVAHGSGVAPATEEVASKHTPLDRTPVQGTSHLYHEPSANLFLSGSSSSSSSTGTRPATLIAVESPQQHLDLFELLLRLGNGLLAVLQTLVLVGLVVGAGDVLLCAEVLDLLARVLDFGQTEGGGGAFEEVSERGELG